MFLKDWLLASLQLTATSPLIRFTFFFNFFDFAILAGKRIWARRVFNTCARLILSRSAVQIESRWLKCVHAVCRLYLHVVLRVHARQHIYRTHEQLDAFHFTLLHVENTNFLQRYHPPRDSLLLNVRILLWLRFIQMAVLAQAQSIDWAAYLGLLAIILPKWRSVLFKLFLSVIL